jgi:predicted DNA-binding transcriptional regulator
MVCRYLVAKGRTAVPLSRRKRKDGSAVISSQKEGRCAVLSLQKEGMVCRSLVAKGRDGGAFVANANEKAELFLLRTV